MTARIEVKQRVGARPITTPVELTAAALDMIQQATRTALLVALMRTKSAVASPLAVRFVSAFAENAEMLGAVDDDGTLIIKTPLTSDEALAAADAVMFLSAGRLTPAAATDPVAMKAALANVAGARTALARVFLEAVEMSEQ